MLLTWRRLTPVGEVERHRCCCSRSCCMFPVVAGLLSSTVACLVAQMARVACRGERESVVVLCVCVRDALPRNPGMPARSLRTRVPLPITPSSRRIAWALSHAKPARIYCTSDDSNKRQSGTI